MFCNAVGPFLGVHGVVWTHGGHPAKVIGQDMCQQRTDETEKNKEIRSFYNNFMGYYFVLHFLDEVCLALRFFSLFLLK